MIFETDHSGRAEDSDPVGGTWSINSASDGEDAEWGDSAAVPTALVVGFDRGAPRFLWVDYRGAMRGTLYRKATANRKARRLSGKVREAPQYEKLAENEKLPQYEEAALD